MSRSIEVKNLSMHYGEVKALDGVSFKVEQGEMLAILGPSGCGKSTLMTLISGLQDATTGEIYIGETRVDALPPQKRGVGFLFQNYALFPHLTVAENVAFGLKIRGIARPEIRSRVEECLAQVGLTDQTHKKPAQLSGGQQQRVALARALAPKPDILLLDEPLSALDVKIRQYLRDELKKLQRNLGITTILVTHDQEEAFELGDRVAVMNKGKIEQIAPPEEIYDFPTSEFVACFVGNVNILNGVVHGGKAYACSLEMDLPPQTEELPDQTPVKIYVRPENFRLEKEQPDSVARGAVRGTVKNTVFQGPLSKLEIVMDNGQLIQAVIPKIKMYEDNVAPGDRFIIRARASQVVKGDSTSGCGYLKEAKA